MSRPGVDYVRYPAGASELILLAHGGQEQSDADPHRWRPALLRMWPFALVARSVAPDAAIGFLRYRARGWNGGAAATDLRTVLDQLPAEITRVALIGHSMGGRVVVAVGDHPRVTGVLALAPWLPPGEPLVRLRPPVVFAHGTADRVTDPGATAAYADRLRAAGTPVTTYDLPAEAHTMLRHAGTWNHLVRTFITRTRTTRRSPQPDQPMPEASSGTGVVAALGEIAWARVRLPIRGRFRARG